MRAFVFLLMPIILSACGTANSARDVLGLERDAPDEFQVVSRPPLSVPKEFFLRPPSDDKQEDIGGNVDQQARSLLTGAPMSQDLMTLEQADGLATSDTAVPVVKAAELESPGESSFMQKVGTQAADKSIRSKLSQENAVIKADEPDIIDMLRGETHEDPVLDAKGEASRLRDNKDKKQPLNTGKTVSVDPKKKSVMDRLFQ
ncbi:MAG: DUF3035 domain-containing protein [Rickettsiales bacterium]|nr:DUF3035 domain-containing protein [Rickettsiales bacterium]